MAEVGPPTTTTEVLERGDIAFFYRPRVRSADTHEEPAGIQRFFLVLAPSDAPARRLRVGRKHLPTAGRDRVWAQVERVGSFDRVLADQLEDERYPTRTRGERYQPGARAVARGSYAVVRHGDHCHLAYRVEHAEPADDVPEEARVPAAASYVLLFKQRPRRRGVWTAAGDPGELGHEDAALVLVGADDEPERLLGIDLVPGLAPGLGPGLEDDGVPGLAPPITPD